MAGAQADDVLWRHVQQLPERCQALLRVIAFAAKPDYAQIARALGMPVGSIGPTRGRCLAKLRLALARRPAVGCGVNAPAPGSGATPEELAAAAEPIGSDDVALLGRLSALWERHDPVPAGLAGRIEFALTLDALETEVATLMQVDHAPTGSRATDTEAVRTVTFTSETLDTMVTLTEGPDGTVRVDGWIAPAASMRVEVLLEGSRLEVDADDDGRFVLESVPKGLAKFALHPVGRTVLSPTIEL